MLWGILAALMITFAYPLTSFLLNLLPNLAGRILLIGLTMLFLLDLLSVLGVAVQVHHKNKSLTELTNDMQQFSNRLGQLIFNRVERRMIKAHPALILQADAIDLPAAATGTFAEGCGFHKLVWLFFISAFLGDMIETVFCLITSGVLMSRSSVVYGPFSIVWGLGVVVLSIMLHRYQDREDRYIFLFGTAMGGVYEYICSVFTELAFGTVFWDYSGIPFNLGGRINLLYCFFWGFASVVWIKLIYPRLSRLIEKIPQKAGTVMTWCIVAFMSANILISGSALIRYSERAADLPPANALGQYLDIRFPDERMERIYPNAIIR
jgi:Predicted membrane protein